MKICIERRPPVRGGGEANSERGILARSVSRVGCNHYPRLGSRQYKTTNRRAAIMWHRYYQCTARRSKMVSPMIAHSSSRSKSCRFAALMLLAGICATPRNHRDTARRIGGGRAIIGFFAHHISIDEYSMHRESCIAISAVEKDRCTGGVPAAFVPSIYPHQAHADIRPKPRACPLTMADR